MDVPIASQEVAKNIEDIKEQRRIRNKIKRLEKQATRKQELQEGQRVENMGRNLHLVASSKRITPISEALEDFNLCDSHQFPAIGNSSKIKHFQVTFNNEGSSQHFTGSLNDEPSKKVKSNKPFARNLNDLIVTVDHQKKHMKCAEETGNELYAGNPLDSDKPERFSGKFKETPNEKRVTSIKRRILLDNEIRKTNDSTINFIRYIPYYITTELESKLLEFVKQLVKFQKTMYGKNKLKAQTNKRYVLGFSQCTRNILGNRVKLLIIATDHKVTREEDAIFMEISKIRDLSIERNVEIIYAFTKRQLANLTKTFCLISCIAILNVDGIHDQLHAIFRDYNVLQEQTNRQKASN